MSLCIHAIYATSSSWDTSMTCQLWQEFLLWGVGAWGLVEGGEGGGGGGG